MPLIRVRDESGEYDWPEDALLDGMTPVEGYPPNLTAQPRPRKALLNLRVNGEAVPGYDAMTLNNLRALAKERAVAVAGTKKADFVAALVAADETSDVLASDAVEEPPTVTTPTAQAAESANTSEE